MLGGLKPRNWLKRLFKPYPYQVEFFDAVEKAWKEFKKVLGVLPTGGGKTFCSGEMICRTVENDQRVLMIAHTEGLVHQFAQAMEEQYELHVSIEMGARQSTDSPVVCASVQSISKRIKKGKFKRDDFGLIVVDEAHRILGDSYIYTCDHFDIARNLGITATPRRGDQRDLMDFYETKAIDIPLDRLIREGFLSKLVIKNIPIHIRLEGKSKTGDFSEEEAAHAIEPYLESIADAMVIESAGRCSLVFLPLISTSKLFTVYLKERGLKAAHIDGTMDKEQKDVLIMHLKMGILDILCCSMLLTEGIDIRPVNLILTLRPTKSWTLYTQIVGRGTRTYLAAKQGLPGAKWGDKTECIILDPLWLCDEHSLLQRPATLMSSSDEEAEEIDIMMKSGGGMLDLLNAKDAVQADRAQKLAEKLKKLSERKARLVDAMELFLKMGKLDLTDYEPISKWERDAITPGQRATLIKNGIDIETVKCKGHATKIIEAIVERIELGESSIKQARYAESLGMRDAWGRSYQDVSNFIEESRNGGTPYAGIEDVPG